MGNALRLRGGPRWCLGVVLIASVVTTEGLAVESAPHASPPDIACQLAIPARLSRRQSAVLSLSVHNRSQQTLHLLKRNTPFEGWLADSLSVEHEGQPVPYSGVMVKRMPPTASEYLHLNPGASRRYRVSLQAAYDVSRPGTYRVQWRGELMDAFFGTGPPNLDGLTAQTIACPAVSFLRTS